MNTFEFDGARYQRASRHQKGWGSGLIDSLGLKGDESILDLGCGDGALTAQLAALVPNGKVLGIDASAGMLATARQHELPNLEFRQLDINEMRFYDEFDVIFSNAALHWVHDHRKLLANSYAALKPASEIHWNFAGAGNCPNLIAVVHQAMHDERFEQYFRDFTWPWFMPSFAEYRELLAGTGFTQVKLDLVNADRWFSDATEMIGWIDQPSIVPFLVPLPAAVKQEFRDLVVEQMVQRTKQPDGRYLEPFRRLTVSAVKPFTAK